MQLINFIRISLCAIEIYILKLQIDCYIFARNKTNGVKKSCFIVAS